MNWFRRVFAWAFLVATIVAQGPHDHLEASSATQEPFGVCDDQHSHWAGHDAADHGPGLEVCPICQHQLQPSHWSQPARLLADPSSRACVETGSIVPATGPLLRNRCRAPPGV